MARLFLPNLEPGRLYRIAVRSISPDGAVSDWGQLVDLQTTADAVAPKAPSGLSWTVEGTAFKATWTAPTQNDDNSELLDFRDYQVTVFSPVAPATKAVYYTNAARFDFPFEANLAAFGTPRANLTIEVRSRDHSGNISATPVTATVANPAPANVSGLTGTAIYDGISLKWNAVTDADLLEYRVYHGTTAVGATNLVFKGLATSFIHSLSTYSTDAYYKVVAADVFGTESATPAQAGPLKPISPFSVDTIAPSVPAGLAATLTNATDGQTAKAVVTWTAVADPDNDLAEYIVGYKPSSETNWQYDKVDYTNTATTIVGLLPYVNYDFRIRAADWAANLSAWSSTVTKTATANTAPATVAGVAVTGGKDSLTIKWTANTEADVVNGAGVYLVDIATNTGFTTGLLSYRTGEASLTVTGLAQGTTYYVRVKAVDSLGLASAAWSTTANATTGTLASQFTYTKAAAAPSSPNTGDIWMDTTTGFEKQWSGSAWVNTGNASINYIAAKGTDLVTNGTGYLKSNYNFASYFDVNLTDAPTGATVSFYDKSTAYGGRWVDELIPFDPTKKYKFSFKIRQTVAGATNRAYGMLIPYDAWGNQITPETYMFIANTTTTLAQPLNNGDTTIKLTSAANWYGQTGKTGGANTHFRSMVIWNWTDPNGKVWPQHTYSRNYWLPDAWADGGVDLATNTITLRAPWAGGSLPAGHPVSNGSAAGTYVYMPSLANQVVIPETWTAFSDLFTTGIQANATAASGRGGAEWNTGMPPGTANIRVGWLLNSAPSPANPTVGRHAIAAVSFSDASAAQQTAEGAVKTYVNEYSVNSSETVAPTTGWSTSTPTRTAGTFVWFRTTVTRADGTTSTTSPALLTGNTGATGSQGIQGTPGANGVSLYTWLKYADTPTTGMSDTPDGKTYIGLAYNKASSTESSNYGDYTWSLIKGADGSDGADGIQGPAGADGVTTYTWVKYADDVNGAGLANDPAGKKYIGLAFNKTTATESTTTTDYQWSLIQGPQGVQGPQGTQGPQGIQGPVGPDGQTLYTWLKYADTPTTGMADLPTGKTYMGIAYNKTSATESSVYTDYQWSLIKGADGATGAAGKGISSTAVNYAKNTDGVNAPSTGWGTSIPATVAGEFLWTRTVTTYTDASSSTAYSVSAHGATGAQGSTGAAGVGISGTVVTYQKHTDGTTAPTGTWTAGIPATVAGEFLWTRTITSYTSGAPTTAYSVAAHGATGSQGIQGPIGPNGLPTYTWIKYGTSSLGAGITDDPTGMTYIGIAYNKTTQTESTVPTDYQWALIQGPQGTQGVPGTPAATVSLTATSQALISPAAGGATNPTTSTVTGTAVNTTINTWTYSVDGAAFSATVPAGVSRTGNVVTITGSTMTARTIAVRMADAAGIADTLTVAKVLDGATGSQGPIGNTGGTGAAGADGYTVILTNEAQVFAGSTSAALAGSATTSVLAYKGATQQTATIGTITGQVTGLTTAITNNGTNNATVTVTVTTALTTQSGTLTIPITVDGKSFTKTFAWSVSYTGATGSQGPIGNTGGTGATGVGITSVTPYFAQVTTGAAAPAKPTTATPSAPWVATEPAYVDNTELYRTEKVLYTDASFAYTNVTKVSAYTAATNAIAAASGKNKVIHSTGDATGTLGYVTGDTWFKYDGLNNIVAQWRFVSGAWQSEQIGNAVIATVDAGKLTAGSAFITDLSIGTNGVIKSAGYTDGGTSGFKLSTSGLVIKGSNNSVDVASLTAGTISGKIINIGAGGTLNVDSSGEIKSNNYSLNSTGYRLSNAGLEVNDGSINAKTLVSGTISAATITLSGANGKIVGTGFDLSGSGLNVTSGTIAAAALQIQSGANNLLPAEYAGFEFVPSFYSGKFAGSAIATLDTGTKYLGTQSVKVITGGVNENLTLAPTTSTYNFAVDATKKYIGSIWVYQASGSAKTVTLNLQWSNMTGTGFGTSVPSGVWTRISVSATAPAGVSTAQLNVDIPASTTAFLDCAQVEEQMGSVTTPSTWKMPGVTSIDGGIIRTGEMRSTSLITVNGASQPAWSINMSGNAQFGDAQVRGKMLVGNGTDTDAGQSFISSGNYVANSVGWKIDSSGNTEFNSGIYRGTLGAGIVNAQAIATGAIKAEAIAIGTFGTNQIGDPSFEEDYTIAPDGATNKHQWRIQSSSAAGTYVVDRYAASRSGSKSLRLQANASGYCAVYSSVIPVVPGQVYNVSAFATKVEQAQASRFYFRVAGGSTKDLTEYPAGNSATMIAWDVDDPTKPEQTDFAENQNLNWIDSVDPDAPAWLPFNGQITIPAGVNYISVRAMNYAPTGPSTVLVDDVSVTMAGVESSELTSAGLRLFGKDGNEVAAFVSNRPNYFGVTDEDGKTIASVSTTGEGAFTKVYSATDPSIMGTPLLGSFGNFESPTEQNDSNPGLLDLLPRGIVAVGHWKNENATTYNTRRALKELSFVAEPGRSYRISLSGIHAAVTGTANTTTGFGIILVNPTTVGGEAPTPTLFNGEYLLFSQSTVGVSGRTITFPANSKVVRCNPAGIAVGGELNPGIVKLLFMLTGDLAPLNPSTVDLVTLSVEDVGPDAPNNFLTNTSTTTVSQPTQPTVKTYTTTWTSSGYGTYKGTGGKRTDTTDVVQGYNSYNGNGKGLWVFPNTITSTLSGATVKKIEVYAYANHWYYNAGGTARIALHGHTTVPGSSPTLSYSLQSTGWPPGAGRWVTLPSSTYAGWKSGTYKGFGMGPGASNSMTYYGRFNGTGAKVRITYVK